MPFPLLTGDPGGDAPASFTRFVLPFAYERRPFEVEAETPLGERKLDQPGLEYAFTSVEPPHLAARELYLTPETRGVLFNRAHWFRLRKKTGQKVSNSEPEVPAPGADFLVRPRGREPFRVRLAAPWMVLFEWPKPNRPCTSPDALRTGFLLLDVSFPEGPVDLEEILVLNEAFRYWRPPFAEHQEETGYAEVLGREAARAAHVVCGTSLADDLPPAKLYGEIWTRLLCLPLEENGSRWQLVSPKAAGKYTWVVDPDPRAYVWTCAVSADAAHGFPEELASPWHESAWVKLLNVERTLSPSTAFERKWADKHTYQRWAEAGTLYGFNHHGGAMFGATTARLPISRHFATIYFDPILLLLYLRCGSFRFSRQLSQLSSKALDRDHGLTRDADWEESFRQLRWAFGLFTNLYEFPLLSSQQQGIEMYSLARKVMDVNVLFEEVREQIQESHRYLEVQADLDEAKSVKRLSTVATVGLAGGLGTGFLGMNVLAEGLGKSGETRLFFLTLFVSSVLLLLVVVFSDFLTRGLDLLARVGESLRSSVKKQPLEDDLE